VARTENDSWEITESVGATPLGVAAARGRDPERESLISDPFAQVFLDAVGVRREVIARRQTIRLLTTTGLRRRLLLIRIPCYGRPRGHGPVHWNARHGVWIVTRYDDVRWLQRRPELFSSAVP
jgi:hypothetical protein